MRTRLVGMVLAAAVAGVSVARAEAPATGPAFTGTLSEVDETAAGVMGGVSQEGKGASFRLKFAAGTGVPSMDEVKEIVESLRWRRAASDTVVRWRVTRYTPLEGEAVVKCDQQVIGDPTGFMDYAGPFPTVKQAVTDAAAGALIAGLRQKLASDAATGEEGVRRVREINARLADVRAMRDMLHAMVMAQPGREEAMASRIKALRAEHERLELSLGAKDARQRALEKAIAAERDRLGMRQANDPIVEELRGVMKLRENEVKRMEGMVKDNVISTAEVEESRAKLADARIKVAEREGAVGKAGKGEILDRLADEMTMTTVDLTDMRLQMQMVDAELAGLNPATATTRSLQAVINEGKVPGEAGVAPPLYGELDKQEKALVREKLVLEIEGVEAAK